PGRCASSTRRPSGLGWWPGPHASAWRTPARTRSGPGASCSWGPPRCRGRDGRRREAEAALPAGVFFPTPLGRGARSRSPEPGPAPEIHGEAEAENDDGVPPAVPALHDPLRDPGPDAGASTATPGPYDRALAAGEELRRKPYVAAGTMQTIRQHAKDRMTVWERIEVLQDPDTQPTVLYQN